MKLNSVLIFFEYRKHEKICFSAIYVSRKKNQWYGFTFWFIYESLYHPVLLSRIVLPLWLRLIFSSIIVLVIECNIFISSVLQSFFSETTNLDPEYCYFLVRTPSTVCYVAEKADVYQPSKDNNSTNIVMTLQVLCVRTMRCVANGVDDGDPSAPRTEKTTAQDCILLSPRNQVYHDPQSSQVTSVCAHVELRWWYVLHNGN